MHNPRKIFSYPIFFFITEPLTWQSKYHSFTWNCWRGLFLTKLLATTSMAVYREVIAYEQYSSVT